MVKALLCDEGGQSVPAKAGEAYGMKESQNEGIASHIGLESCGGVPEGAAGRKVPHPPLDRMAKTLATMIGRVWRANGVRPYLVRGFKVSNDPKYS